MCQYEHEHAPLRFESTRRFPGLERLICAALADQQFAARLVAETAAALEQLPHALLLSPEECALAISITGAIDIHDFASRLHTRIRQAGEYGIRSPAGSMPGYDGETTEIQERTLSRSRENLSGAV
jgi:hypothetical protein